MHLDVVIMYFSGEIYYYLSNIIVSLYFILLYTEIINMDSAGLHCITEKCMKIALLANLVLGKLCLMAN